MNINILTYTSNIKNNLFRKENLFLLIFVLGIFFLDRISKKVILEKFNSQKYYINEYINLDLVWNTGIGFGLFSYTSEHAYNFLTIIIFLVITFLIFYALMSNLKDKIAISIIIGGASGNFYDRIIFNAVPDFIDLHIGNFHWFTFNVADIFITLGIILYIVLEFEKKKV